jgi:hypothetical protein
VVKENTHARIPKRGLPAAPSKPPAVVYLDQLWKALSDEDRRQTLTTLSQIVAKQLQPPPEAKEVPYEDQ